MLRANCTDEDRATFQQLRYSYPDERIMRRFEILWLHSCGKIRAGDCDARSTKRLLARQR